MKEEVRKAALRAEGKLWIARNHGLAWWLMKQRTGNQDMEAEQGFVTSRCRFVDRAEAALIMRGGVPKRDHTGAIEPEYLYF